MPSFSLTIYKVDKCMILSFKICSYMQCIPAFSLLLRSVSHVEGKSDLKYYFSLTSILRLESIISLLLSYTEFHHKISLVLVCALQKKNDRLKLSLRGD